MMPSQNSQPATLHGSEPRTVHARALVQSRPANYLRRAGVAASYPVQGIWYFVRHREYWPLFTGRLLPLSLISFLVYLILFTFAFLPQYAFLAIFHGWGAWVNAVVLTLGEGLVIIQGLFEGFFVDECRVDVFDATLIRLGFKNLIEPHRILFNDAPTAVSMLGKPTSSAVYTPWSMIQMVELVVFLPLNLIPYVGTPAFIIITGTRLGKLAHYRWYQLRGLSKDEAKRETRLLTWDYIWFGTVAMVLELIPILSFFFLLTTTTGSAIWVAKIEDERNRRVVGSVVANEDVMEQPPPPYSDDMA
ncbi:hypothetical protein E4U09_001863 [Claviceps aff. purpurea]|uniref:Outer spore wall protein RRT8 n=1 Tax=Claviceps aff. purpurea TaxID=1967640 RepID=A0A9P7U208_9HYPO|nr:hypothetical protein E4U09_001863 [Claviceps aff. purpurea]